MTNNTFNFTVLLKMFLKIQLKIKKLKNIKVKFLMSRSVVTFKGGVESCTRIIKSRVDGTGNIKSNVLIRMSDIRGNIQIGNNSKVVGVQAHGELVIGRYSSLFGPNITLASAINKIEIGSFCSIARGVTIQEYNHRIDKLSTYYFDKNIFKEKHPRDIDSKGVISIGSDVWIGTDSIILSGVSIGHGAIIAAGSIVVKNVPPYAIVAGNPAKLIRYRYNDKVIGVLLNIRWWEWSNEKIMRNKDIFKFCSEDDLIIKLKKGVNY